MLALGGGAVTSAATRELLVGYGRGGGTVVWLDVDLPRPPSASGSPATGRILGVNPRAMLRHMLETRAPLYGEVATLHRVRPAAASRPTSSPRCSPRCPTEPAGR